MSKLRTAGTVPCGAVLVAVALTVAYLATAAGPAWQVVSCWSFRTL